MLQVRRTYAEEAAVQNVRNLALVFEEHVTRSIKEIDESSSLSAPLMSPILRISISPK